MSAALVTIEVTADEAAIIADLLGRDLTPTPVRAARAAAPRAAARPRTPQVRALLGAPLPPAFSRADDDTEAWLSARATPGFDARAVVPAPKYPLPRLSAPGAFAKAEREWADAVAYLTRETVSA